MGIRKRWRQRERLWGVEIDFRDQQGRHVFELATTFASAKDERKATKIAEELLATRRREVREGKYVHRADKRKADAEAEARRITFAHFAQQFLRDYASTKRSTFYAQRIKRLMPRFGQSVMAELRRADFDQFIAERFLRGIKSSTIRRDLAVLSVMFNKAIDWNVVEVNPLARLKRPKEPPHKTRYLTVEEWTRVEASAPPWLRPLLAVAVATGLRMKELTELRWADFDKTKGILYLSGDNKCDSVRAVPVGPTVVQVLDKLPRRTNTTRIFVDREGEPFTKDLDRQKITKATLAVMKAAGVERASFHTLRHTAATWAYLRTRDQAAIQRLLGHSTPLMTMRYVNLAPEDLRPAVLALDAVFAGQDVDQTKTSSPATERPVLAAVGK